MAKMSHRVKHYEPKSKKACVTAMATFEAIEEAKNVIFDIHTCNKSWGDEWYEAARCGFYFSAIRIVERVGKGNSFIPALTALNCLLDLSEHMKNF